MRNCISGLVTAALCVSLLCGCGHKLVFTTSYEDDELFSVGDLSGTVTEMRVYCTNLQKEYEQHFGQDVWQRAGNAGLEDAVKANALARLSKVKVCSLMAEEQGIELTSMEEEAVQQAAQEYAASLNEADLAYLQVDEADLYDMYRDYYMATKVYAAAVAQVPEISDDEARTVTIQSILVRTWSEGENGERVEYSESEKNAARQKAEDILREIRDGMTKLTGVTFDTYITRYNEDNVSQMTIGRGETDPRLEEAAFDMEIGAISDVIETSDGYRIIKCISGFDREQTDARKHVMEEERRQQAFEDAYNSYLDSIEYYINKDVYDSIGLAEDPAVETGSFFEIYDTYFR